MLQPEKCMRQTQTRYNHLSLCKFSFVLHFTQAVNK